MAKKRAIVCGAGGFIGSHLVKALKKDGYWVRGIDLKLPDFSASAADEFLVGDLRDQYFCKEVMNPDVDEVYQLAADMGGAGYIFTGNSDADIMHNSALINLNTLGLLKKKFKGKVFFSSSACVYPEHNQRDPNSPDCEESSCYPANPDSEYGWEKIFSERLYLSFKRNYGMNVRIARFHNIFGEEGTWQGGKEKAPAAICRKVAEASNGGSIELWGDGLQTRSFLYIRECIEGIRKIMASDYSEPINLGSDEMIAINKLAELVIQISGKKIDIKNIPGPTGVRGRNSHNELIEAQLGWRPSQSLEIGIAETYQWIQKEVLKLQKLKATEQLSFQSL